MAKQIFFDIEARNKMKKGVDTLANASLASTSISAYTLSSRVAAVPEPTEFALLLSGVGLLGFVAARRKSA